MNLLPKSSSDFGSRNYWNQFFAKRGHKEFEWYGEYTELCNHIHKYVRISDKILVAGCGNSTLSADLYKVGFKDITNIDISEVVISQMVQKYELDCPDMKWHLGDIFNMNFDDESFSCILDKGTLDALMSTEQNGNDSRSSQYFANLSRVTKIGGRYICISLLQDYIIDALISWFPSNGWIMRFSRCVDAERKQSAEGSFSFPVFVVICTKFKKLASFTPFIELDVFEGDMRKVQDFSEVKETVSSLQHLCYLQNKLRSKHIAEEEITLELCDPKNGQVKYRLFILDSPKSRCNLQFAVFIVPHGRETEWMFSTYKGHSQLAESANASRLVVVHLMRNQTYGTMKDVQDELSPKILELAQSGAMKQSKIPFLSVGDDLGERREVFRGRSNFSGEFIVEDVKYDSYSLRRLIFLKNQHIIQSEAKLVPVSRKRRKKHGTAPLLEVDLSYLSCSHHFIMIAALEFVSYSASLLLIGLGGGSLASFIHKCFPAAAITAVDIDETILEVAKSWFGFKCTKELHCVIDDGIDFIQRSAIQGTKYDIIIFDIDSKEVNVGLSCPPRQFLEKDFLDKVSSCISDKGMFALNLVCRDEALKDALLEELKGVFPSVIRISIPEEVNDVLFCRHSLTDFSMDKTCVEYIFNNLNKYLKTKVDTKEYYTDINDIISRVTIL